MNNHTYILLLILAFSLSSCGVKKNAVQKEQQTAAPLSLEQRVASGEFAWLDTIQNETTNSVWVKNISGNYILSHPNMLHGQKMYGDPMIADSLVITTNGYYYKYNNDSLVDFGRFNVRNHIHFKVCVEQFKVDLVKGEQTNEIERVETEIYNPGEFLTDWYSYTHDYHCFWTICRQNNPNRQELEIIVDINNDCVSLIRPENNMIKWEKKL